jgi:alpha-D-ribose 1-methylphosphonate 5-triphosphate synthase subunit PhnH
MAVALAFADPVQEAQRAFRAVMNALARPGTIQPVAGLADAPAPLSAVAAAVALTLADYETPLFLDTPLAANPDVARYLAFHSGARVVAAPSQASFAVIADPASMADFADFALGTDIYPDRSTTLILQVKHLSAGAVATPPPSGGRSAAQQPGEGATPSSARFLPLSRPPADLSPPGRGDAAARGNTPCLTLSGPGIKGDATLSASGLPADIAARLAANHALFPRGVDLILAGPDAVAALPRTTRIRSA